VLSGKFKTSTADNFRELLLAVIASLQNPHEWEVIVVRRGAEIRYKCRDYADRIGPRKLR
jgi:hypothetical protein